MCGTEVVTPKLKYKIPEFILYFKRRMILSTYPQLNANFTCKIDLHKFTRIMS